MDVSPASLDALLNAALLHFLESHTNLRFRHGVATGLASAVNAFIERPPAPAPDSPSHGQAQRLAEEGWAGLGQVLTADQVARTVAYFAARPCFNAPTPGMSDRVSRRIGEGAEGFHDGSYELADVVGAPFLLEVANRPEILAVAESYLGCTPTLYSLNAGWSFARPGIAPPPQFFRRDADDYKFCSLFVYLTEVGRPNGPCAFIRGSHRADLIDAIVKVAAPRLASAGRSLSADDLYATAQSAAQDRLYGELFGGLSDTITGPAGFAFIADTGGLHKTLPPAAGRRLLFRARYGLYRNTHAAVMGDTAVPPAAIGTRLPRDLRTVYINRCLIRDASGTAQDGGPA